MSSKRALFAATGTLALLFAAAPVGVDLQAFTAGKTVALADAGKSGNDTGKRGNDTGKRGNDTGKRGNDTGKSGNDTGRGTGN